MIINKYCVAVYSVTTPTLPTKAADMSTPLPSPDSVTKCASITVTASL